ncbi:MAG: hypothetical protein ACI4RO_01415, partial [Candidatus Scatosoma sp.]
DTAPLFMAVNTSLTEQSELRLEFTEEVTLKDAETGEIHYGKEFVFPVSPADGILLEQIG